MNDYIWLAESGKICTFYFQGPRKKNDAKSVFLEIFQKLFKTIKEPIIKALGKSDASAREHSSNLRHFV